MVDRFHSKPLELPEAGREVERADLVFYGVEHSGPTYEGRIFLGAKRGLAHGAGVEDPAYAGSFYVFGHTGCYGDEGHCEVPSDRDPFDYRLPHHLEPGTQIVTVTGRVRKLVGERMGEAKVLVFAHAPDGKGLKALEFTKLRLVTYAP